MYPAFSPCAFQVFAWDWASFLRKCHFLQQKRECIETPHPPPLTPDLAPSIPEAVFPAMWLALTKGGELDGNSLLTAFTPEFPATSYAVVSITFLLKHPCFSLPNQCSLRPRACAGSVPEPPYCLFLFQPSVLAEVTEVENPTSSSPSTSNLYSPMHVPSTPSPNLNALIICYLWKNPPISMYWYPAICKLMRESRHWVVRQVGWSCDRAISVTLEFDDKLRMFLISPSQPRAIQLSKSQPKMFSHGCDAVHRWRHAVPDLRSMIFRCFFHCPWKMALCMCLGTQNNESCLKILGHNNMAEVPH